MNLVYAIRQFRFPQEFRIAAPAWDGNLEQVLLQIAESAIKEPKAEEPTTGQDELCLLAEIGTGLWRLKQGMVKTGTNQPLDELRRPFRHLESIWDAFVQAGGDIQDHTDRPFDAGMSLKVISHAVAPGLRRERVIETIKPTIYFKGKRIQMGEVVVGRPQDPETPMAGSESSG